MSLNKSLANKLIIIVFKDIWRQKPERYCVKPTQNSDTEEVLREDKITNLKLNTFFSLCTA